MGDKSIMGDIKMRLFSWFGNNALLETKKRLIDVGLMNSASFADLGGVWGVDGGYTFYALNRHNINRAVLVDTHPTASVLKRASKYSQLEVITGNFGSREVAERVGNVDAVFLFDVLLHQVRPDWNEVLRLYAQRTSIFIIYNQQWTGSGSAVRLLELGEKEYFLNVPHSKKNPTYTNLFRKLDTKHPDHDRNWRDVHHIWQWGITDQDLEVAMIDLGFRLSEKLSFGKFGRLENFENKGFVFRR